MRIVKQAADNKQAVCSRRGSIQPVLIWGNPKGGKAPIDTRLCGAKCGVLYALSVIPHSH